VSIIRVLRGGTSPNDGGFQREKSEDPIIGEPIYIHANMVRFRACVYETLHVQPDQPALRLHSGTCEDDVSTSSPADQFGSRADGTERALRTWSSPDITPPLEYCVPVVCSLSQGGESQSRRANGGERAQAACTCGGRNRGSWSLPRVRSGRRRRERNSRWQVAAGHRRFRCGSTRGRWQRAARR